VSRGRSRAGRAGVEAGRGGRGGSERRPVRLDRMICCWWPGVTNPGGPALVG